MDTRIDFAQMFRNDDRAYEVREGDVIFAEGDPADFLYVILEGGIDIHVHGRRVQRLGPGEVFGEMALVENRPRAARAIAHMPARLVAIDERRFIFLVGQTPFFALGLLRLMAARLRAMDETVS